MLPLPIVHYKVLIFTSKRNLDLFEERFLGCLYYSKGCIVINVKNYHLG